MSEEKKLTDEEIVKALEICANRGVCRECPYTIKNIDCCEGRSEKDGIDLIHRLQKENKGIKKLISKTQLDLMFEQAKTIEQQTAEIKRLESETEEQYKRIMELEQDLVHADEKVFYRECDVALNEKKIANKALTEFAEKVVDEAFVVFMGEPIIRASKVRELLKEFTNEN